MNEFAEFMRRETAAAARLWGHSKPAAESLRRLRANAREEARAESRKSTVSDLRSRNRNQNQNQNRSRLPMTLEEAPTTNRRAQLAEWKTQKARQRANAPKGRPPFKAGVYVRHPDRPVPASAPAPAPKGRITRASARNKPKELPPFAPLNAQFRPPALVSRVQTPPRPRKRKTNIFTQFLPSTASPATPATPEPQATFLADLVALNSPNVTLVRGKSNIPPPTDCDSSPERTAHRFKIQLDGEITRLLELCDVWKNYRDENNLSENHQDMINVVIGQTHLLIDKKFQQFRSLIVRCETREIVDGEGLVNVDDLRGFWDMVYMQVENLDIRFNELKNLKDKNWKDDTEEAVNLKKKKVLLKKNPPIVAKKSSGLKAMILARRKKLLTVDDNPDVKIENQVTGEDVITFNGGFFSVTSPAKNKSEPCITPARTSLRYSVLSNETKKRLSVQTPINVKALLTANSYAKCIANDEKIISENNEFFSTVPPIDLNKTPGKSILKTPLNKTIYSCNSKKQVKLIFSPEGENLSSPRRNGETNILDLDNDCKENISENSKENQPIQKIRQSKRILSRQSNVQISPSENVMLNESNSEIESKLLPIENLNFDILVENRSSMEQNIVEDSFLEVFGISKKLKRKSHVRNSIAKNMEGNRKSVNLISFESPRQPAYVTRSVYKKTNPF